MKTRAQIVASVKEEIRRLTLAARSPSVEPVSVCLFLIIASQLHKAIGTKPTKRDDALFRKASNAWQKARRKELALPRQSQPEKKR